MSSYADNSVLLNKDIGTDTIFFSLTIPVIRSDILSITSTSSFLSIVREKKIVSVPISLFRSTELSAYELITTYLKESLGMTLTQIAKATGRNPQAVYITLRNAREKLKNPLSLEYSENDIPLKIIADRDFSILECIVAYLVEKKGMSLAEISKLLYRDNRTIWTIYDRFKKKREKL
jgi:DNA-binding CsgD family transcriptional regulator